MAKRATGNEPVRSHLTLTKIEKQEMGHQFAASRELLTLPPTVADNDEDPDELEVEVGQGSRMFHPHADPCGDLFVHMRLV
ncbi:MAG: hypothetical protein WCQ60_01870 [bacterium]